MSRLVCRDTWMFTIRRPNEVNGAKYCTNFLTHSYQTLKPNKNKPKMNYGGRLWKTIYMFK